MLKITIENNELQLEGRFDASQEDYAMRFFNQIKESAVINFSELEYISSCGLGILLGTQKRLKESGGQLKLINMSNHIRDIFHYAGFDLIFEIE